MYDNYHKYEFVLSILQITLLVLSLKEIELEKHCSSSVFYMAACYLVKLFRYKEGVKWIVKTIGVHDIRTECNDCSVVGTKIETWKIAYPNFVLSENMITSMLTVSLKT